MTSYTDMARQRSPTIVPGPTAHASVVVDHWLRRLPASRRQSVEQRLAAAVQRLPEATRLQILRKLHAEGEESPIPLGVEDLGCLPCAAMLLGCACEEGMGSWGALATAVVSVGTGVWGTLEQKDLQKDLAKMSGATQEQIARIQAEAAVEAQRILAEAQVATAQQAAAGMVGVAQSGAPIYKNLAIGGGVVAAIGLGVGAIFLMRKKKGR